MMKKTSPAGRSSLLPVLIDLREKHVVLLSDADSCEDAVSVLKALIPCTDHLSVLMTSCGSELKQKINETNDTIARLQSCALDSKNKELTKIGNRCISYLNICFAVENLFSP